MAVKINNSKDVLMQIAAKAKQQRLEQNWTQQGLAERSGVSLGSLKRFESTGEIALYSLLKLAFILECLDDFTELFNEKPLARKLSIDDIINQKPARKRGSKS